MRHQARLCQQMIVAMRCASPSMTQSELVSAALAVLAVPRIRAALEMHDLKEMAHAQEAAID